jgi:hypothetical protein
MGQAARLRSPEPILGIGCAARRAYSLAASRRAVIGFVRFVEDKAVVEFGQWNIDADFGHGEDGSVEKKMADPVAAGAGEDGRGDSVLFEDDVALDRGCGAVFLKYCDAINARCAWAEDFEDDNGNGDKRARIWAGGADDEAVRITDSACGFDFQIASKEIARLPAQSVGERDGEITLDGGGSAGSAGHRDGLGTIRLRWPWLIGQKCAQVRGEARPFKRTLVKLREEAFQKLSFFRFGVNSFFAAAAAAVVVAPAGGAGQRFRQAKLDGMASGGMWATLFVALSTFR